MNKLMELDLENALEIGNDIFEFTEEEAQKRFAIVDLDSLNWVLRMMAALDTKKAEIDALAEKEIARIQDWQRIEHNKISGSKNFFESLVARYALQEKANVGVDKHGKPKKFKTIKTIYGSVGFSKQQPKWEINDDAAIAHFKAAGLEKLIDVKESVKKSEAKKVLHVQGVNAVDANGEIVPGILVYEQEDKLKIKVGSDDENE